ncbi:uncharacterized protein LOC143606261 [Bidens hawaiensis]|uniref:uncharacterized protein LOC143606261 n=1 Tax=Bidens hawaiensis TaxID=980011 RepID=UPI004049434B
MVKNCKIELEGHEFPATLLGGFDVVLGVDCLFEFEAQIVCRTKGFLRRGSSPYLVYVVKAMTVANEVKDVPVVCDYLEVFPEDLPRVPPEQEVEFQIELVSGAQLVAKAPYCPALSEMKVLMFQLQEILDKGFIRPSVSSWGALMLLVKKNT